MTVISWEAVSMIAIVIGFLIASLGYLLSSIINSPLLASRVKQEISSIFMTLILFSIINYSFPPISRNLGFINDAGKLQMRFAPTAENLAYCTARIFQIYDNLGMFASFSMSFGVMDLIAKHSAKIGKAIQRSQQRQQVNPMRGSSSDMFMFNPGGFIRPFLDGLSLLNNVISFSLANIYIYDEIAAIFYNNFSFLLGMGILLRVFYATRNGGNILLALLTSFYLILPFMIWFSNTIEQQDPFRAQAVDCKSTVSGRAMQINLFNQMLSIVSFVSFRPQSPTINSFIDGFSSLIYTFAIKGMIFPFLSMLVTLGAAREIAGLFGTEVDFSSVFKVI